jgi:GH25 family lysozyme M1 (1,4-beta-N-acetylmuramidase)
MDTVLGCDTSFYQDRNDTPATPDYTKAFAQGARFCIHRIGQGESPDPDFHVNRANSIRAGLLDGSYLLWDYRYRMSSQIDLVNAMLGDARGAIQVALDLERVPYWKDGIKYYAPLPAKQSIYAACDQFIGDVYTREKRYPLFYTNLEFLLYIIPDPTPLMLRCPLWMAAPGAPLPPARTGAWEKATFVQHDWHGDGRAFGMESGNIDLDVFMGTYDELLAFTHQEEPPKSWEVLLTEWARNQPDPYTGPDPI